MPLPFRLCLPLLLLAACNRGKGVIGALGSDSGGGGDADGGGADGVDADGDGSLASDDCDDSDPGVYPDNTEVCDGLDQDCDDLVDEGVPGDGAGCQDPGWPALPDAVDVVHLSLRTGDGETDGTDDTEMELCLGDDLCFDPTNTEWDDFHTADIDVITIEGVGVDRGDFDRFSIGTTLGDDSWGPAGFQVSLDDTLVYCREPDGLRIGNDEGQSQTWLDPDGLGLGCTTIFDAPLTHGPMIGAVGADDARIWLRTDSTRQVLVRVAADEAGLAAALPAAIVYPRAADDFMADVQIVGLGPDATWLFDIEIDGERYGPWTLRTAPAIGAQTTFRLAIGSCTKDGEQPVFAAIRDWAPDTFLFLGDTHYGNTHSLSTMRQNNRWAHARPERAELLNETSMLSTWDDHDYLGNNTGGDEADRSIALRAFTEAWANPPAGADAAPGVYFQHSWGDIDLFVLDVRSYRGVDDDLLGDEQTNWLLDALEQSTATFKLLAGGSQFSPDGTGDAWSEYDDAWPDLQDALADRNIEGLVLLSGDIHRTELRWLDGGAIGYDLPEITSSPLANETDSCNESEGETVACWDEGNGFVGIEIDTSQPDPSLSAVVMDEDGVEAARLDVLRSQLQR